MLLIILAESSLELVPPLLVSERDIQKFAKKHKKVPEKTLLDINYHWKAIRKLKNPERHGRPDIIYRSLLSIFDSPVYKCGLADVIVHTINNKVIYFKRGVRLPRHYSRFVGLMEQVLYYNKAPVNTNDPLIYVLNENLIDLVRRTISIPNSITLLLTSQGTLVSPSQFYKMCNSFENISVIIGGFSHGHINTDLSKFNLEMVSIFNEGLTTQAVCNYVLYNNVLFMKELERNCF